MSITKLIDKKSTSFRQGQQLTAYRLLITDYRIPLTDYPIISAPMSLSSSHSSCHLYLMSTLVQTRSLKLPCEQQACVQHLGE